MTAAAPATLDRAGIAARVPHAGRMCLLDALLAWSDTRVRCRASGHRDADHPLRTAAGLPAAAAIEYAAQAMALHGALSSEASGTDAPPTPGMLVALRRVRLLVPRLDTVAGALTVDAERLAGDAGQALYAFALRDADDRLLVDGRATVLLGERR